MKRLVLSTIAAIALFMTASSAFACQSVNANGGAGYVNIREKPELNARVLTQLLNPKNGSDWGSAQYCGTEYVDFDGRTWSFIYVTMQDGTQVQGWVSDKVLEFLPY